MRAYDPADVLVPVPDELTDEDITPASPLPATALPWAGTEVDPVTGFILAPLHRGEDGKTTVALGMLPDGTTHGDLPMAEAPQGARNAAAKIDGNWVWRLIHGEGWALREGKGPERSDGTRPKLRILEPCRSVTLRAVGVDQGFPDVQHHVVIAWVQLERTGRWAAEAGWLGSTEPMPTGLPVRRWWVGGPRRIGVSASKAVLGSAPDAALVLAALAVAADSDQDVST